MPSTKQRFEAKLVAGHKGEAVLVPFDPARIWGTRPVEVPRPWRQGHLVKGTVNGKRFEGWIGFRWGRFFLLIDEDLQRAARLGVEGTARVVVEPRKAAPAGKSSKAKIAPNPKRVTLAALRRLAITLPGVEEGECFGTPAWRVGGKLLARLKEDGESLVVKCGFEEREALLASDPSTFYLTDHYLNYPSVLVRLSKVGRTRLRQVLETAWQRTAPKRLRTRAAKG